MEFRAAGIVVLPARDVCLIFAVCGRRTPQSRYRSLWEHYYCGVQAIIYVLDSTDRIRMCVAKNELEEMLTHEDIKTSAVPFLFFANKADVPGALSPVECMQLLELDRMTDMPWHITSSNALSGEGIDEGIKWLAEHLASAPPASHK